MGSSISLDNGIQQYELYLLLGDLSSIFDEVVEGKVSIENGKHLVMNRLYRLNRVSLNEKPKDFVSSDHYKIFPNGKHLIEITEKYRDADGKHAWSVAIQYRTSSKIVKILHGVPGSKKESEPKNVERKRMTRSVSLDDLSSYSLTQSRPQGPFVPQAVGNHQMSQSFQGQGQHSMSQGRPHGQGSMNQGRPNGPMTQGPMMSSSLQNQGAFMQSPAGNQGYSMSQGHHNGSFQPMNQKYASEPFHNQHFRSSPAIFNDGSDNIGFSNGGGGGDEQDVLELNMNGYG